MWNKKDKKFNKPCYIEVTQKRKKIIVEIFLEEHYCGQPVKRFQFKNTDTFKLSGIYTDITIEDYENSYS